MNIWRFVYCSITQEMFAPYLVPLTPSHPHPHISQTHSHASELEQLRTQHSQLLERVRAREELLSQLQRETSFLNKQHTDTLHEVRKHLFDLIHTS